MDFYLHISSIYGLTNNAIDIIQIIRSWHIALKRLCNVCYFRVLKITIFIY